MNTIVNFDSTFEGSTDIVHGALRKHLEEHGKSVEALRGSGANTAWSAATQAVGAAGERANFNNPAKHLALSLAEKREFDILILSSFFLLRTGFDRSGETGQGPHP